MGVFGLVVAGAAACGGSEESDENLRQGPHGSTSSQLIQAPANGGVVTLAGTCDPNDTTFNDPAGVAVGPDGTIYVTDWGNNDVRTIAPDGTLGTFVGGKPNLLRNPRAEGGGAPAQWSTSGSWTTPSTAECNSALCGFPLDGMRWFAATLGANATLSQNISGALLAPYAQHIADGVQRFRLSAFFRSKSGAGARALLGFASSTNQSLGPFQSSLFQSSESWNLASNSGTYLAPIATTNIIVALNANSATYSDVYFDGIQLRPLPMAGEPPSSADAGLVGPTAIAVASNGDVYVGGDGVTIIDSARTTFRTTTAVGTYLPPRRVSSIALVSASAYFADPTDPLLHVRGPGYCAGSTCGFAFYKVDVGGAVNAEPMAVVGKAQADRHLLRISYRGSAQIKTYDCGTKPTTGGTLACNLVATTIGSSKRGFVDDMDGVPGGERLRYPHALANGRFGDLIISDQDNHAVRRTLLPLTLTSAGTGRQVSMPILRSQHSSRRRAGSRLRRTAASSSSIE